MLASLAVILMATTATPPKSVTTLNGKAVTPVDTPFRHGETLTLAASYMGINAGLATMTVDTGGNFSGRPAIHVKLAATTSRTFSVFFKVNDAGESWIDPDGLFSLGYLSDQSEGAIQDKQTWTMDYDRAVAVRDRVYRKGGATPEKTSQEYPLSVVKVQDAASMLYFFRAFPLKVGDVLESDVFVDRKVWKLKVEAVGQDHVKVPAGSFDCLKIVPSVAPESDDGSVGRTPKAKVVMWVTADDRRIPVKIQTEMALGKVNALLQSVKEGR